MLVLSRKIGESIQIGDQIRIQILSIQRQSVKIGVVAPKDVAIHREEIYEKISEENKKATKAASKNSIETLFKLNNKANEKSEPE